MEVIDATALTANQIIAKVKAYLDNVYIDYSEPSKSSSWYEPDFGGECYLEEELKIENLNNNLKAVLDLPEEIIVSRWLDDDFQVKVRAVMDLDRYQDVEFEGQEFAIYEFYKIELIED